VCETSSYAVSESNTKHRMDSDSDEEAHYISTDTEDEQQPCPPSPISRPASPDYSASSSEDEGDVDNVAGRQPQPPKHRSQVVHNFIGAPKGKSSEAALSCPAILITPSDDLI
jgi:hypothetical protein